MRRERKQNKIVMIIKNVLVTIMLLCSFVICYFAIAAKKQYGIPSIGSYIPVSIQSNSMKNIFQKGDLILSKKFDEKTELKKGDIITFYTFINGKRVLNTHRIQKIWFDDDKEMLIQTKGTNNVALDEHIVKKSEIIGIYSFRVPFAGRIIQFMQSRFGFFICILFPLFVAFLIQLIYTIVQYSIVHKDENVRKMKENYSKEITYLKQQMSVMEKQLYLPKDEDHKTNQNELDVKKLDSQR